MQLDSCYFLLSTPPHPPLQAKAENMRLCASEALSNDRLAESSLAGQASGGSLLCVRLSAHICESSSTLGRLKFLYEELFEALFFLSFVEKSKGSR